MAADSSAGSSAGSSADRVPLVGLPSRDLFVEAADLSNADLERRLLTLAGQIASAEAEFLIYLGAFDLARGWEGWPSCPAWLSWFTSMGTNAAREHVRVARALRELPLTRQAMVEGRLSFSKVRALTRVAEPVTEAELVETAQAASAAQLDRICAALVKAVGKKKAQQRRAAMSLTTHWDRDGNLVGTFCLPPEDGKALLAAIERLMPDPIKPAQPARSFDDLVRAQDAATEAARAAAAAHTTSNAETSAQTDADTDADTDAETDADTDADTDAQVDGSAPKVTPAGVSDAPMDPALDGSMPKVTPAGVSESSQDRAADDLSDPGTAFARSRAVGLVELARHSLAHPVEDGLAATSVETVIHVDAAALDTALVHRRLVQTGLISDYPDTEPDPDAYVNVPHPSVLAARAKQATATDDDPLADIRADLSPELRALLTRISTPGLAVGWVEDGPALALETVERLLCDTNVRTRCGHEHPDAPDPRTHRTPSRALRRRLWRRDGGCRAPGCARKHALHAHHIQPWHQGGPTTLANMLLLCEAHHHLVHEGGWTLTLNAGRVTLTSPDGRKTLVESPRTAGSSHQLQRTRPTTIDNRTISGAQTGDRLDLGFATNVIAHNIELARRTTTDLTSTEPETPRAAPHDPWPGPCR